MVQTPFPNSEKGQNLRTSPRHRFKIHIFTDIYTSSTTSP